MAFLFKESGLLCHFRQLTGIDRKDTDWQRHCYPLCEKKRQKIITFGRSGVTGKKQQDACWKVLEDISEARLSTGSSSSALLGVVQLIMALLDEKKSSMFQLADVS